MIERDPKAVFVVHGRNEAARDTMFAFLKSIGLLPLDWESLVRLTGKGAPYVGEVLDAGFKRATAAVVLFTPDDEARLRPQFHSVNEPNYEKELTGQPRPNVILETGMALALAKDRTILVEFGALRPISDISGRHVVRINNSEHTRKELASRLETAGCPVCLEGEAWKSEGDFDAVIDDLALPFSSELDPGYSIEAANEVGISKRLKYEIEYPQMRGLANSTLQQRINRILEQEVKSFAGLPAEFPRNEEIDAAEDEYDIFEEGFLWMSFSVELATPSILSLQILKSVDHGGAHPSNDTTGIVLDLDSGYKYSLDDLVLKNQNYVAILKSHVERVLEKDFGNDSSNSPPELEDWPWRAHDFFLTESELVFVNLFPMHALNGVWARLPLSDLQHMADPSGPLYRLIASRADS